MRVAVYARFSTELQNARSIDDQVALCNDFVRRHGWTIVDTYADYAVSGSSVHGRFAFERLLADARRGAVEIILAEDLDRLSRNQADIAGLYERMTFAGVHLWTVADGEISEMHIGLKGTMSALFLRALALKTHRGLQGRVRAGKSAGGRCYGYRVTTTGEREIHDAEAAIVQRIFEETAAGRSPRAIVGQLNAEAVPGPRGGAWNASTLHGSAQRANGILRNELYIGRIVWNRQRFLKDPDTGRRVSRPNAASARHITDVPHLRIIDQPVWDTVQASLEARSRRSNQPTARSPRHLLSGLCRCGVCGGAYVAVARGKLGCSHRRERSMCDNRRMISIRLIEDRILAALEEHLLDERVVAEALREYVAETKRLRARFEADRAKRERRMAEIDRAIRAVIAMVEGGTDPLSVVPRMRELEAERDALKTAAVPPEAPPLAVHPGIAERYREVVRDLRDVLAKNSPDRKAEVFMGVRDLIDRIVIYAHGDAEDRDIELHGKISALLGGAKQGREGMRALVAGTGFERSHTVPSLVIPVCSRGVA